MITDSRFSQDWSVVPFFSMDEAFAGLDLTFDIIILSLDFPDTRGKSSLASIRQFVCALPVIVVTDLERQEAGRRAMVDGAHDFLIREKLDPDTVSHVVRIAFERHTSQVNLERVLGSLKDGICIVDTDMTVRFVNQASYNLLGADIRSFIGEVFGENSIRTDSVVEMKIRKPGRSIIPVEVCITRTVWSGSPAFLLTVSNITHRYLARSHLKQRERADRYKDQFLANMCHEIRTPLNAITSICDKLAKKSLGGGLDRLVVLLSLSCDSLTNVVDDILDFSRIQRGKLQVRKSSFDVKMVVEEAISIIAGHAKQKGLDLTLLIDPKLPEMAFSDPHRIRQILLNFLTNSVKFTDSGEITVLVALVCGEESDVIRFEVSDTGIGIDKKSQEKLFEPFSQVDGSASRNYGGAGLGLCISKRLSELLNGQIGFVSESGAGSTFWFTVPSYDPEESTEEFEVPHTDLSEKRSMFVQTGEMCVFNVKEYEASMTASGTVLLVEDNEINRELTTMDLESMGLVVEGAISGLEALEMYLAKDYDLILMDCQLPILDGYETTRRIREFEKQMGRARVPIVALTAHAIEGERDRCLKAGMNDYMSKPYRVDELRKVLYKFTRSKTLKEGQSSSHFDEATIRFYDLLDQAFKPSVLQVLRTFSQDSQVQIDLLASSIEQENQSACREVSHKLKGTCLYMGFRELAQKFAALEKIDLANDGLALSLASETSSLLLEYVKQVDDRLGRVSESHFEFKK